MIGRVSLALSCLVSISILLASSASAQERAPEACGQTEAEASYGSLDIGTVVTLQRHRMIRGDDNWDTNMERFLGRAAHVARLSGVDAQGCPGIRVDVDGGEYFWRIRDLGIGTGLQPLPDAQADSTQFPQQCHQSEDAPNYGAALVGATVILGRHRPVDGETNWADEMQPYVGMTGRITQLGGLDTSGCPGIRVDIDQEQWFWRVRDLHAASEGSSIAMGSPTYTPSLGVTTDHGRPPESLVSPSIFGSGGLPGPQDCGLTDASIVWAPIAVGVEVVLGRHREVNSDANWDTGMEPFVGMTGHVTQLAGADEQGCPVVRIDLDNGSFVWRVRDMTLTLSASGGAVIPHACGMRTPTFGTLTVGTRVILGRHTPYSGPDGQGGTVVADDDWAPEMSQFVGQTATITRFDDLDPAGCPGVRVNVDAGQWFWRIRDMQIAP